MDSIESKLPLEILNSMSIQSNNMLKEARAVSANTKNLKITNSSVDSKILMRENNLTCKNNQHI